MLLRDRLGRVEDAPAVHARPDGEDERRPVARADDRVRDLRWAVEEVPLSQRPLLSLDDERARAVEHEERLLTVLAVIHRHRLAGREHVEVEAHLGEALAVGLESAELAHGGVVPLRIARVEDEPAAHSGSQPS